MSYGNDALFSDDITTSFLMSGMQYLSKLWRFTIHRDFLIYCNAEKIIFKITEIMVFTFPILNDDFHYQQTS